MSHLQTAMLQTLSHLDALNTQEISWVCAVCPSNFRAIMSAHSLWQLPKFQQVKQALQVVIADYLTILDRDPAARNWLEVLCCYSGLHALVVHRLSHWLHTCHIPLLPRLISSLARFFTGIEIHPAATIGKGVLIDHGMGVVIGETAIIGDYVVIYQGVTLGGTGKETGKRHPTVGNHAILGAGAKVLGNIQIGDHVRVGAGSIVLRDIPAHCTVVGIPGRICRTNNLEAPLECEQLPDPEADILKSLLLRLERLEQQVLESHSPMEKTVSFEKS